MIDYVADYCLENGKPINLNNLTAQTLTQKDYSLAHANLPIACHDAFLEYRGGIILVTRDNVPAKNELWPLGGRIKRGVDTKISLKAKIKEESGLDISTDSLVCLGCCRTFFTTDPFGHGRGTDTFNVAFYGRATGKLNLDKLHKNPQIITPADYTPEFRKKLHPYIRDFMDKAINLINA